MDSPPTSSARLTASLLDEPDPFDSPASALTDEATVVLPSRRPPVAPVASTSRELPAFAGSMGSASTPRRQSTSDPAELGHGRPPISAADLRAELGLSGPEGGEEGLAADLVKLRKVNGALEAAIGSLRGALGKVEVREHELMSKLCAHCAARL